MITENSRRFVVTQFENCGFPNCSGALSLRLRAIALALRGAPTVQQFRHRRRSFLEAARCRACASRTAATDETESPPNHGLPLPVVAAGSIPLTRRIAAPLRPLMNSTSALARSGLSDRAPIPAVKTTEV